MISRTVRKIYQRCAWYNIDGAPDVISTVRLIYRRCAWYNIEDSAPDIKDSEPDISKVRLIWYQGQCAWYDIKDIAPDMISTVHLIWYQGQCIWYDIKDSAHDMISGKLCLIWYRQWIQYDIRESVPDMISTVNLIYQGDCAWYDIDGVPDMISRTAPNMTSRSTTLHFTLPERKSCECGHSSVLYATPSVSLCTFLFVLHSCATSRKTDLPLYWLSSP
jgi:hypothetical protein